MSHAKNNEELFRLLAALCDEQLTPAEGKRLAELLHASPQARVGYVRYLDLHASLRQVTTRAKAGEEFADWLRTLEEEGARQDAPLASPTPKVVPRWGTALVGLATAIAIGLLVWRQLDEQNRLTPGPSPLVVARLASAPNCTWESLTHPLAEGSQLHAGQWLTLTSGVARLEFNDQTTALVESPATLELMTDSSLRLHAGTVALRANGDHKDFVVHTANAAIVDLGTSFGVHSGPEGVDIEVFEGQVEILPDNDTGRSQILGLGTSARLLPGSGQADIKMFGSGQGRFTDLLQMLWEDMRSDEAVAGGGDAGPGIYPRAEFDGAADALSVDSFHGARSGKGWVTPWVGSGNPIGQILGAATLSGPENPYLKLRFYGATRRTIAREYGATESFDPEKPHVISWVWRFEGADDDFGDSFADRVAFYGMPYFRDNSSEDSNWMIGWTGDHEKVGPKRRGLPKRWFAFDGTKGDEYDTANLVDTGMQLKPGVVYRMAVVIYPATRQYDAIIQDDEQTFVASRLRFRSKSGLPGKVLHFGVGTDRPDGDATFSVDSIRVEPLRPDLIPRDLRFNVPSDPGTTDGQTASAPSHEMRPATRSPTPLP